MFVKGDMMGYVSSQEGTTDLVVRNSHTNCRIIELKKQSIYHDTGWLVGILAARYKAFKPKVAP